MQLSDPCYQLLDLQMMDELEMDYDTCRAPKTNGRLRPQQQRSRKMARRALLAKLIG